MQSLDKDNTKKYMSKEPLSVQIHNKLVWDLSKMKAFDFYTIGYSQIQDIHALIDRLNGAGVETLVDVRHNPISRFKPDFSKSRLEKAMTDAGIAYVHYSSLGIPKGERSNLNNESDYASLWKWYDSQVVPLLDNGFYENIISKLKHPVAYMCTELDPTKCHRHRIALALEKKGLRGFDL